MTILLQSFVAFAWYFLLQSPSTTEGFVGVHRGAVTPTLAAVAHRTGATEHPRGGTKSSVWLASSNSNNDNSLDETDPWMSNVKNEARTKMIELNRVTGGVEWEDNSWTPFITEVAELLRLEGKSQKIIVNTLVGLLRYGVTNEEELVGTAGTPPTQKEFRETLRAEGVPAAICDKLFQAYVSSVVTAKETGTLPFIDEILQR